MRTIQPKIVEIPGAKFNGKKTSGNIFSKLGLYLARLSYFLEILENAVPFATGSCRNLNQTFWLKGKRPTNISVRESRFIAYFFAVVSRLRRETA